MLPYWILFAVFAAGAFIYQPRPPEQRRFEPFFALGGVAVAVMVGLRYRVGVDWSNYVRIYEEVRWQSFELILARGDPLFYVPMWAMRQNGFEIWAFFLLCGAVFAWGLFTFAKRLPNPWLGVLISIPILVIIVAMSGVRQATAIGFVFLALAAYRDRSLPRFLLWIACAALCHASAVLIAPIAALSFARNRLQTGLLLIAVAAAGFLGLRSTFENYTEDYVAQTLQSSGAAPRLLLLVAAAVLFYLLRRRIPLPPHEAKLWRNISLISILALPPLMLLVSSTAVDRVAYYLFPLQMLVMSWIPLVLARDAVKRFLVVLGIVIYTAAPLFVFLNYAVNRDPYLPYRFWPVAEKSFDVA